jgi:hypothetical protein
MNDERWTIVDSVSNRRSNESPHERAALLRMNSVQMTRRSAGNFESRLANESGVAPLLTLASRLLLSRTKIELVSGLAACGHWLLRPWPRVILPRVTVASRGTL